MSEKYGLIEPFSIAEYIVANELGVDATDTAATRLIAEHLRTIGYAQRRLRDGGKARMVWQKVDRKIVLDALAAKLDAIRVRKMGDVQ